MSSRRLSDHGGKPKTRVDRFMLKIPLFISYGIFLIAWIGFIGIISIHEVLLRRNEKWHFIEQMIIFHALLGLTIFSLTTAASRSPGQPDQSLAPRSAVPHATIKDEAEDDDVPLRYLQNSQWVTARGSKDRPSPLPLPSTRPPSEASSSAEGLDMPAISPFPFAASPFVPASAIEAGEDEDEDEDEEESVGEGQAEFSGGEGEGDGDRDRLLQARRSASIFAKSNTGGPRWCKKCNGWKPDRCHHCRWCQRCTLKMDHHCVWLGQCVGHNNYKPFLLYVTYCTLLSVYGAFEAGYESYRFFSEPDAFLGSAQPPPVYANGTIGCDDGSCENILSLGPDLENTQLDFAPVVFMVLAVVGIFFTLLIGPLAGFHWWLTCNNITTLEHLTHSYPSALLSDEPHNPYKQWKPDHLLTRSERYRLRNEAKAINVYDLGWRRNVRNVLVGDDGSWSSAAWPLAISKQRGDTEAGHVFEYDEAKLEKLKGLTRELRLGGVKEEDDSSLSGESDHDEDLNENNDNEKGEDESHDEGDTEEERKGVRWFEPGMHG